jgi:hypothetical protein
MMALMQRAQAAHAAAAAAAANGAGQPGHTAEQQSNQQQLQQQQLEQQKEHLQMPQQFVGVTGVYDIAKHYAYEKDRGVHSLSTMLPAMGGFQQFAANSPSVVLAAALQQLDTQSAAPAQLQGQSLQQQHPQQQQQQQRQQGHEQQQAAINGASSQQQQQQQQRLEEQELPACNFYNGFPLSGESIAHRIGEWKSQVETEGRLQHVGRAPTRECHANMHSVSACNAYESWLRYKYIMVNSFHCCWGVCGMWCLPYDVPAHISQPTACHKPYCSTCTPPAMFQASLSDVLADCVCGLLQQGLTVALTTTNLLRLASPCKACLV